MFFDSLTIAIHVSTLLLTAVVILYSDHRGLNYFRGKEAVLPEQFVWWSHRLVLVGLFGMIASGFFLVLPAWEFYLQQPQWYVKMGLVGVLIANSFAIGTLSKVATTTPFAELGKPVKQALLLSGAFSAVGWIGAITIGVFFL